MASKKMSDVWNFFKMHEVDAEKTVCKLCDTTLSYKSNSTKSMWNHLRAKHSHAMADGKSTILNKFCSVKQPAITSFAKGASFSKEKQEECYIAAAKVGSIVTMKLSKN